MLAIEKFRDDKEKNILACKYKNEINLQTNDIDYLIDFILNNKHLFRTYEYYKVN